MRLWFPWFAYQGGSQEIRLRYQKKKLVPSTSLGGHGVGLIVRCER
jgi:hypothetical protein